MVLAKETVNLNCSPLQGSDPWQDVRREVGADHGSPFEAVDQLLSTKAPSTDTKAMRWARTVHL